VSGRKRGPSQKERDRKCVPTTTTTGGLGFGQEQEEAWVQENVRCIRNAMMYAGMLEGTPDLPGRYLVMHSRWRVAPSRAGYLEPLVGLDRQFTEVQKGEALARLIDPYTLEEVEVLRSPGRGVIFYACRPYMIRPGQWAFGVGNLEDGKTGWYARDAI
jgi:predicted deacylase